MKKKDNLDMDRIIFSISVCDLDDLVYENNINIELTNEICEDIGSRMSTNWEEIIELLEMQAEKQNEQHQNSTKED